ncbi:uncharacterized protein UV8b_01361 [Ustilaginoidea virens]|uniref:AAA+ ATPase domain-containing protein n=1 Tax=Ustilaginoidea virens TaxID=1159556 RepID=A0A8E5HKH2_USTVR|nr:uncharacterized protein UV8b_01361 [Ustilaginoidea virens]QUC17120.1 hypothetical protein UV8b_01361 [Ustilaginoidea virens]
MAPGLARPRLTLRSRVERDVYTVLKQLEAASGDGRPFKTVGAAYDAIQHSNSSLKRQKKRPLEDAIDRVLLFRKQEADDSSDSEAALDEAEPTRQADGRFLLNRQMTKLWHQPSPSSAEATSMEPSPSKKRRVQEEADEVCKEPRTVDTTVNGNISEGAATSAASKKQQQQQQQQQQQPKKAQKPSRFSLENLDEQLPLAGLGDVYDVLLNIAQAALKFGDYYQKHLVDRRLAITVAGPNKMGKKMMVRNLASTLAVPLVSLKDCFLDADKMEKNVVEAFDAAIAQAPSVVFIENVDHHMSAPGSPQHNEHHSRAVRILVSQMERLRRMRDDNVNVLAIATTSKLSNVDPALFDTDLFEETLEVKIPDYEARKDVLRAVTARWTLGQDVDVDEIARITHGYVPGELFRIATEAVDAAIRRLGEGEDTELTGSARDAAIRARDRQVLSKNYTRLQPRAAASMNDFVHVIKKFTPSLRREGFTVIPDVTWGQVGALDAARQQLHRSIIGPIKRPEMYARWGLTQNAGVLLWGPPGCGKTLVAQAVANDANASFILINGPELLNKYVGESERAVRELFSRARSSKPCILFFDEIDSIVPPRANSSTESGARVVNALLTELDGAQDRSGVYVIGTTNRPEMIDEAILRPGRLGNQIFIDLPTPLERVDILRAIYRTRVQGPSATAMEQLAGIAQDARCDNFSGADLSALHTKAAETAMERWMRDETTSEEITGADWEYALQHTRASVKDPDSYRARNLML